MPKKPRVRKLMDGQHVEWSERLPKSAPWYLCQFFDHSQERAALRVVF